MDAVSLSVFPSVILVNSTTTIITTLSWLSIVTFLHFVLKEVNFYSIFVLNILFYDSSPFCVVRNLNVNLKLGYTERGLTFPDRVVCSFLGRVQCRSSFKSMWFFVCSRVSEGFYLFVWFFSTNVCFSTVYRNLRGFPLIFFYLFTET